MSRIVPPATPAGSQTPEDPKRPENGAAPVARPGITAVRFGARRACRSNSSGHSVSDVLAITIRQALFPAARSPSHIRTSRTGSSQTPGVR